MLRWFVHCFDIRKCIAALVLTSQGGQQNDCAR